MSYIVSIVTYFVEHFNNMVMMRIDSKHGENMTFYVSFRDGTINICQNKSRVLIVVEQAEKDRDWEWLHHKLAFVGHILSQIHALEFTVKESKPRLGATTPCKTRFTRILNNQGGCGTHSTPVDENLHHTTFSGVNECVPITEFANLKKISW